MTQERARANGAALPALNRRRFLELAPGIVAVAAPAVYACTRDPIPGLIFQYQRVKDEWEALPEEHPESEALWTRWNDLEDKISTTPATSREGLLAQTEFVRERVAEEVGFTDDGNNSPCQLVMETLAQAIRDFL